MSAAPTPSPPAPVARRDILLVAGTALLVRLAYFFLNWRSNPAFRYLIMDSMHIDHRARAIAAGQGDAGVYFRGPLYPYLLAGIYRLTGGSVTAAVLVNHLAGVATCVGVCLLAREYFARPVPRVAGLLAALYWPLVYFEGEILIEPVFVLLLVFALWRTARAVARPTVARCLAAGACIGLAALARPTILALVPAVPIVFLLARPRGPHAGVQRRALAASGLLVAACALVLTPATVHNYRAGRALVPITWSGGLNFYLGNNPSSDGRSAAIPEAKSPWMGGEDEALTIAAEQAGHALSPAQASNFYLRRGLEWATAHPGAALVLDLRKLHMFWEGPERSNEKFIYFFWDRFGLGKVPMPGFWLVSPLSLAAMVLLRKRWRELSLLYLFVLAYMLGVVLFFVVARFRLPVTPVLIIFAAALLVDLFDAARARRWMSFSTRAALFLACFLVANATYPSFAMSRGAHIAISHYALAGAYTERNDQRHAILELDAARRAFERSPSQYYAQIAQDIYFKLGSLWYQRGNCEQAVSAFGQIQPSDPRAPQARRMFAKCCEKLGRFPEAGRAYEIILKTEPGDSSAVAGLIRCLEATGRYADADTIRQEYRRP